MLNYDALGWVNRTESVLVLFKFATKHPGTFLKFCNKKLDMRDLGLAGLCALLCSLQLALHLTPEIEFDKSRTLISKILHNKFLSLLFF